MQAGRSATTNDRDAPRDPDASRGPVSQALRATRRDLTPRARALTKPAKVAWPRANPLIFRKGLDMKEAVAGELPAAYHSALVDEVRAQRTSRIESGRLTIHLAREFGFCYGVDRAVDYAYQTRRRFPDRHVFLTGEIIHNPHVNDRLRAAGIRFLTDPGEAPRHARPGRRRDPAGVRRDRRRDGAARRSRAARSSTRPAGRCSTSGRTSSATRRTASPRSSTARCSTRRRAPRRRRR